LGNLVPEESYWTHGLLPDTFLSAPVWEEPAIATPPDPQELGSVSVGSALMPQGQDDPVEFFFVCCRNPDF